MRLLMLELLALRLQTKELVLELADVLGVVVISTVICYVNGAFRVLKMLQVSCRGCVPADQAAK